MKYTIVVTLNEKGQNLCGKETYEFSKDFIYMPTPQEISQDIDNKISLAIMESFDFFPSGKFTPKVGNIYELKVTKGKNQKCFLDEVTEISEDKHTFTINNYSFNIDDCSLANNETNVLVNDEIMNVELCLPNKASYIEYLQKKEAKNILEELKEYLYGKNTMDIFSLQDIKNIQEKIMEKVHIWNLKNQK